MAEKFMEFILKWQLATDVQLLYFVFKGSKHQNVYELK